jgi:arginine/lysine/histidine/glutamine transport system substrate-binding/permease protein
LLQLLRTWRLRLLALLVLLAVLMPSGTDAAPSSPWRVATDPTSPPFGFRDTATNKIVGFDIDLMQAIGVQAGHPIEWVTLPFDGLIPALQARSIDASIAAMIITPERSQVIDFSQPYFRAGQAIVVRDGGSVYRSLDELKGLRIAVQIGTVGALAASQVSDARVSRFDSTPLALQELANGNADAMVGDVPEILYAIDPARLTGLRISGENLSTEYYGIAFPKNSPIAVAVNEALTTLIANGRYAELYRKWFAAEPPQLPMRAPSLEAAASPLAGLDLQLVAVNLLKGAAITLMLTALSFSFGLLGGTGLAVLLQTPCGLPHLHRLLPRHPDAGAAVPDLFRPAGAAAEPGGALQHQSARGGCHGPQPQCGRLPR